jgi:hypothetical protein
VDLLRTELSLHPIKASMVESGVFIMTTLIKEAVVVPKHRFEIGTGNEITTTSGKVELACPLRYVHEWTSIQAHRSAPLA